MQIPVLETPRLILRGHTALDLDASTAMWADPITVEHIGGKPSNRQQSWSRLMHYRGHWELMGFGYWAVEEKSSGEFVGEMGFADFKRVMTPSIEGIPEMGWAIVSTHHRQGFATEALSAVVKWGEQHFKKTGIGGGKTVCIIDPENLASLRVAEKFGYLRTGPAVYNGESVILFSRQV